VSVCVERMKLLTSYHCVQVFLVGFLFVVLPVKAQQAESVSDIEAPAELFYNGLQTITCSQDGGGKYVLRDLKRGIYTYDASYHTVMRNGFSESFDASAKDLSAELLRAYKQCSGDFGSDTPNWEGHTLLNSLDSISVYRPVTSSSSPYYTASLVRNVSPYTDYVATTDTIDAYHREVKNSPVVLHFSEPFYTSPEQDLILLVNIITTAGKSKTVARVALYDSSVTEEYSYQNAGFGILFRSMRDFQPALDAHWGIERAYDYYNDRYGVKSFDGKGTPIHLFVNPSPLCYAEMDAYNAGAYVMPGKEGFMFFGMGGVNPNRYDRSSKPLVFMDVLAHEYTHLVVNRLGNTGETGALNESYADIMSKNILFFATGKTDWQTGAEGDYERKAVRSFSNPVAFNAPMCYGDACWADTNFTANDNGGVHTNCSVQNHWFYLLCTGGEGTNTLGKYYKVQSIDRRDAEDIVFHAFYDYSEDGMTYQDARENAIKAATELFGAESQQVISVQDAWAAVGVGDVSTGIAELSVSVAPGKNEKDIHTTIPETTDGSVVFSLQGVRVDGHSLPHGVYIINGKKQIK